ARGQRQTRIRRYLGYIFSSLLGGMPGWVSELGTIRSIPTINYDEFLAPLNIDIAAVLSLDTELELIRAHGAKPLIVLRYPIGTKLGSPDAKIVSTNYGLAIESLSENIRRDYKVFGA